MTTVKWLALALTVIGGLTIGAGAILVPLAALKFSMVTLGMSGAGAFGMIATGIRIVSAALLTNPIGLTLTAIATAAVLIYANWDKLKGWWTSMLDGIISRLNKLKENLRYLMPSLFGDAKDSPTRSSVTSTLSASPILKQAAAGATYQLNFNTAPGADNRDLAAQVGREIERIEARKAARNRGALRDTE